jgi:hypothetical protein
MIVIEFSGLAALAAALADVPRDSIVLAVPPGTTVVGLDDAHAAYDALDGEIVLAASAIPRVDAAITAAHPVVSTPYRFVAADAIAGPAGALRALVDRAAERTGSDVDALTQMFLEGADIELDIGASLFVAIDGTGTDVLMLGGRPFVAATGTFPPVIIGAFEGGAFDERDDLLRLLGYEGAVADSEPKPSLLAPELVALPFWTTEQCGAVIRAAEASGAWASDPDDPVPGAEIPLAQISPGLFAAVEAHVGEIVVPALRDVWPEFAWNGLHDAFIIKYVGGGDASSLPLHHDVAQISASVRLNDGYLGGALEFPRQGWDNRDAAVGDLIAWPSLVTHPHRALPVERGVKYGLTLWFALPS